MERFEILMGKSSVLRTKDRRVYGRADWISRPSHDRRRSCHGNRQHKLGQWHAGGDARKPDLEGSRVRRCSTGETRWKKTRSIVQEKVGSITFSVLSQVLTSLMKGELGLPCVGPGAW